MPRITEQEAKTKTRQQGKRRSKQPAKPLDIPADSEWHDKETGGIAWEMVAASIQLQGVTDAEIALELKCSEEQLAAECLRATGETWQRYAGRARSRRSRKLRFAQSQAAFAQNVSMLTLLGKEELGQGDDRGDEDEIKSIAIIECPNTEVLEEIRKFNRSVIKTANKQ